MTKLPWSMSTLQLALSRARSCITCGHVGGGGVPLTVITRFFTCDNRPHREKCEMGFCGRNGLNGGVRNEHRILWELACLRWHHCGPADIPSCLHRRQASSHISQLPHWVLCLQG